MQRTNKIVGHVRDVIEPRRQKQGGARFYGFIVSDHNEKVYFRADNLRIDWQAPAVELINKLVAFEAVTTPPHSMRQAVDIEIISGAAA